MRAGLARKNIYLRSIRTRVQIPNSHIKVRQVLEPACNLSTLEAYRDALANWLDRVTESTSFWFSERPCLRKYRTIRKDTWCRHLAFKCVHSQSCTHVRCK